MSAHETRTSEPTPEQLLKLLDSQLTMARAKRAADSAPKRTTLLVTGLCLIVFGCGAALLVLQFLLSDLQERQMAGGGGNEAPPAQTQNF